MKANISFDIDTNDLSRVSDEHLVTLWYVVQANPAPIDDEEAGELAEQVGREIIARWVRGTPVPLWYHQGRHASDCKLTAIRSNVG